MLFLPCTLPTPNISLANWRAPPPNCFPFMRCCAKLSMAADLTHVIARAARLTQRENTLKPYPTD